MDLSPLSSTCGENLVFLDTKGLCFICLQETSTVQDGVGNNGFFSSVPNNVPKLWSFEPLSRCLKMNNKKVFTTSIPFHSTEILEKSELLVSLCRNCSGKFEKFSSLFRQLEVIQMQLTCCIQTFRDKVTEGESDDKRLHEYRRRMKANNPLELPQIEIVENLRREMAEKSLSFVQKTVPRVQIQKLESRDYPDSVENDLVSNSVDPDSLSGLSDFPNSLVEGTSDYSSDLGNVTELGNQILVNTCNQLEDANMAPAYNEDDDIDQIDSDDEERTPRTPRNQNLNNPIRGPKGRKLFYCKQCDKYVPNLAHHNKSLAHWPVKPHECMHCRLAFSNSNKLRVHTITKHFAQPFMSLKDPNLPRNLFKAAVDLILLNDQKVQNLPKAEIECSRKSSNKRYHCTHCSKHYMHRTTLRAHIVQAHYDEVRLKLLKVQKNPDLEILEKHAKLLTRDSGVQKETVQSIGIKKVIKSTTLIDAAEELDAAAVLPKLGPKKLCKRKGSAQPDINTTTCPSCDLTLANRAAWTKHTRLECKASLCVPASGALSETITMPTTSSSKSLRSFNKSATVRCDSCQKFFSDQNTLMKHKSIQHEPVTLPANGFQCEHCLKKFRFFFSYRIHLLTIHRLQVFSRFAPGTKFKVIQDAIKTILQQHIKQSDSGCNKLHFCNYCPKEFAQATEIENHIVVTHFDEVVLHLKEILEDKNPNANQPSHINNTEPEKATDDMPGDERKDPLEEETKVNNVNETVILKEEITYRFDETNKREGDNINNGCDQIYCDNPEIPTDPSFILP